MIKRITQSALFTACAAWLLYVGCVPHPLPPPTTGDAGTVYVTTCQHLAAIGCSDGTYPECAQVLETMVADRLTNTSIACLQAAGDATQAKACGGVGCK